MKSRFGVVFLGIVLIAVCMIPFLRAWNYDLIDLDDYSYLTLHPPVLVWQGLESLRHCFTDMKEGIWMPLTFLSYALDWRIFGSWYGGFHIHSILIHFVNACLVWWLLAILFPRRVWTCLLAALVWAVHPLRCESVVFLASRKDLLSFLWEALALVTWFKASLAPDGKEMRGAALTGLSLVFFVLGSMCKPSVMTFPVLCLVVDAFIVRRIRPCRYVAPVCYMVLLAVFAHIQQAAGGATVDTFNQPLYGRLLGAAAAYGIYLRNFIWPQWLSLQCLTRWPGLPHFWLQGLIVCAGVGWWFWRRLVPLWERRRELFRVSFRDGYPSEVRCLYESAPVLAGALWFSLAVAPMLGVSHFGYHAYADRFTYIPAVGLSVILVAGMDFLMRRRSKVGRFLQPSLAAVVLCLACATWRQTGFWENDLKLFTHTLEVDGQGNTLAHELLALWYFEFPHDVERCAREFDIAVGQNIVFSVGDYDRYIIALAESGRAQEIPGKMKLLEKALEEHFGREYLAKLFNYDQSVDTEQHRFAGIYRLCKIAWLLCDARDYPAAKELIDDVERRGRFGETTSLTYLKMRYAEKTGDKAEAKRLLEDLQRYVPSRHFHQFRFLRTRSSDARQEGAT